MDTPKIIELTDSNTCKICENRFGKYTCPRCNILYCTVTCYQSEKHMKCSETFYQKCVYDELKSEGNDSESKAKMEEILKRFHEQTNDERMDLDSDDDDDEPDLAERLSNIDLNNVTQVWEHLTQDERQEFEALVVSGDVTKFVPIWKPWWDFKVQTKLVQEVGTSKEIDYKQNCPLILENIKPFNEITKVPPANCVQYNLLNVIAAYSCIIRYFNGDHFEFANEAVYLISSLSKNLQLNENFETYSLALESVHQQILVNDWMKTDEDVRNRIYNDVKNIVQGPENENKTFYIKCVLSDLHRLVLDSKKNSSVTNDTDFSKRFQENEVPADKIIPKEKLKMFIRKIEYYLSYVSSFVPNFN